jgi:hypothetical protein
MFKPTFPDFLVIAAEDAVTTGCQTTLLAIGAASASVIGWNWVNLGGSFAAGAIVSLLTSFAKKNVGVRNTVTILSPGDTAPKHATE